MTSFPVIAFAGRAGAGKSTAALLLMREFGFKRVSFAGPLKDMMRVLGLPENCISGEHKEDPHPLLCGKTPREAMQTLGTEWGRSYIGEMFWINLALEAVKRAERGGYPGVVIDDARFPNEFDLVRREGWPLYRIVREAVDSRPVTHPSEEFASQVGNCIQNDGTEADLKRVLRMLATSLGAKHNYSFG